MGFLETIFGKTASLFTSLLMTIGLISAPVPADYSKLENVEPVVIEEEISEVEKLEKELAQERARREGLEARLASPPVVPAQQVTRTTLSHSQIINKVKPAVVFIETDRGLGSGFIIDSNGHILTNDHVVSGSQFITVKLLDGRILSATLIGRDASLDVAVLKINAINLPVVILGSSASNALTQGDKVFTLGYPFGIRGDDVSFKEGVLSRRLNVDGVDHLEISAEIHPGNSGGPLVNDFGEVVGINTFKYGQVIGGIILGEAIKFALPIDAVKPILSALKAGTHASAISIKRIGTSFELAINNKGPNPVTINHLVFIDERENKVYTTHERFTQSPDGLFHFRFMNEAGLRFKVLKGKILQPGQAIQVYLSGIDVGWRGIEYEYGSITDAVTGNDIFFESIRF